MLTVTVDLNKTDVAYIKDRLRASIKQLELAEVRGMRKVLSWAKSNTYKLLAEHHDMPVTTLKGKAPKSSPNEGKENANRVYVRNPHRAGQNGYIWVGENPIKAAYLGKLRQLKKGAKVRGYAYQKGFVAPMKSGHVGIYKRVGKDRLPIDEQAVKLHTAEPVIRYIGRKAGERLTKEIDHQLNYILSK